MHAHPFQSCADSKHFFHINVHNLLCHNIFTSNCYYISVKRVKQHSILSSVQDSPPNPSISSAAWTSRRYAAQYNNAHVIEIFNPPFTARHLSVFSAYSGSVTLVEVMVFGVGRFLYQLQYRG